MLNQAINRKTRLWLHQRFPKVDSLLINHQRLFIMPTRFGALYLVACLTIFILGTNYQNNPILLLSYFLFFMFIWSLHACFNNLIKCQFHNVSVSNSFAGEPVTILCEFKKQRTLWPHQVTFWLDGSLLSYEVYPDSNSNEDSTRFAITIPSVRRGHHFLPLIKIKTEYPFGLVKSWSFLHFKNKYWTYPKPIASNWQFDEIHLDPSAKFNEQLQQLQGTSSSEGEERQFDGLKSYTPGAPMSQVAWKQYAKQSGDDLLLKDFTNDSKTPIALTLHSVQADGLERKLSALTHAVLQLEQQQRPFVLSLTGYQQPELTSTFEATAIPKSQQQAQIETCLQHLACFASPKSELLDDSVKYNDSAKYDESITFNNNNESPVSKGEQL